MSGQLAIWEAPSSVQPMSSRPSPNVSDPLLPPGGPRVFLGRGLGGRGAPRFRGLCCVMPVMLLRVSGVRARACERG